MYSIRLPTISTLKLRNITTEPHISALLQRKAMYSPVKMSTLTGESSMTIMPKRHIWAALALLGAYAIAYVLFGLLGEDKVKLLITAILLEIAEALIVFFAGCVYCYIVAAAAFVCIGVCTVRRLQKMLCH